MSLRKKSSLLALLIVFTFFIVNCGILNSTMVKYFNPCHPSAESFFRHLYSKDNSKLRSQFDLFSDFTDDHIKSISEVMNKETFQSIKSMECVGQGIHTDNNIYFANYLIDFTGGEKFYGEVVFNRETLESRSPFVMGLHAFPKEKVLGQFRGWTNNVTINLLFACAVLMAIFSLVVSVLIIHDHRKNWIAWLLVSQIGLAVINLDMTSGNMVYRLINIGFPIFTVAKSEISPWSVSFMLPLFALIYLIRRKSKA